MTSPAVRLSYAISVSFFACVTIAFTSVAYSSYNQRQADRRWCDLFDALDPAGVPPSNARGHAIAQEMQRLQAQFGCTKRK